MNKILKPTMILAGGTGFIGQELIRWFHPHYHLIVLTRQSADKKNNRYRTRIMSREQGFDVSYVHWDGKTLNPGWTNFVDGSAVLINLTGKTVNCRYHRKQKEEILNSRVDSTRVLAAALAAVSSPPKIWINLMSATIYRQNFGEPWDENGEINSDRKANMPDNFLNRLRVFKRKILYKEGHSLPDSDTDFSVFVCEEWEKSFFANQLPTTRQIALRAAIVLGTDGVLVPMKTLCNYGLGGCQGNGEQFFSWISSVDLCRMISFLIDSDEKTGIYNAAAPIPVTNRYLMKQLRGSRPGLPAPAWLLEIGAMLIGTETELLLKSRKVISARAMREGFYFEHANIEDALAAISDLENK